MSNPVDYITDQQRAQARQVLERDALDAAEKAMREEGWEAAYAVLSDYVPAIDRLAPIQHERLSAEDMPTVTEGDIFPEDTSEVERLFMIHQGIEALPDDTSAAVDPDDQS